MTSTDLQRISKLIATGLASEVQMDAVGLDAVLAAKSSGPQVLNYAEEVQQVGEAFRFLLSTEAPDRRGDIVRQAGLDLGNYRKNPVVLLNHDSEGLPIGKGLLTIDGPRTWMDVEFSSANPLGAVARAMTEEGTLKAASISILPKKVDPVRDEKKRAEMGLGKYGVHYLDSEVLEGSVVTLPMNADAVRNGLKVGVEKGLFASDLAEQFERAAQPTERDMFKRCGVGDGSNSPSPTEVWSAQNGVPIEPEWSKSLRAALGEHASRIERAVASLHVKQAAASGAAGAQQPDNGSPGSARFSAAKFTQALEALLRQESKE